MNLLLHRHFARREVGDAASAFGAMLPDLVRMVDRGWRPRPDRTYDAGDPEVLAVLEARFGMAAPLTVARLMTEAALARQESRGAHFRSDFQAHAAVARHSLTVRARPA